MSQVSAIARDLLDKRGVADEVGKAQRQRAALPRAEQIAGAAQFEVGAGDLGAAGGADHHLERVDGRASFSPETTRQHRDAAAPRPTRPRN